MSTYHFGEITCQCSSRVIREPSCVVDGWLKSELWESIRVKLVSQEFLDLVEVYLSHASQFFGGCQIAAVELTGNVCEAGMSIVQNCSWAGQWGRVHDDSFHDWVIWPGKIEVIHRRSTSWLTPDCDFRRISSEISDVCAHPFDCQSLIQETEILIAVVQTCCTWISKYVYTVTCVLC